MNKNKKLSTLLKAAGISSTQPDIDIEGLSYDSRKTKAGDLFFAMKGVHVDAHDLLDQVQKKGASVALVERPVKTSLPTIQVPSMLKAMSSISNNFFDEPSQKIPVIGITGTNGKTTITYLIEDIFKSVGKTCGVMGTINYRFGSESIEAPNTTPMSMDVHEFLAQALEKKCAAAVMEVSSHALELNRVDTVKFSIGVFTNLTQDHLDFHKSMECYFKAKSKLFLENPGIKSVINLDDEYGQKLATLVKASLTYGQHPDAQLKASEVVCNLEGIHFKLTFPSKKSFDISTNLMGRHNVENCLAAAGALLVFGLKETEIVNGLNRPHAVPGRLERVEAGQHFVVVVDYAHTEDALYQVLSTLKATGPHRLLCVFGAGGDRDKTKRPKMGQVAVKLADHAYLTSDNPRSEDPKMILKDIEAGVIQLAKKNYSVFEKRDEAIRKAIQDAGEKDIVLIAGKGHETYQIYGDKKFHFSDQEVAKEALTKK